MKAIAEKSSWTEFLRLFSEQNFMRPTRLGVFEGEPGEMRDYWLEDGLPLAGIDADTHERDSPTIEIMLGNSETADSRAMTHVIRDTRSVKIILSPDGSSDGLEVLDAEGSTTFLRFES